MVQNIQPVSYTHLDVYKRQEFDKAFPPKIKEKIEGQLEERVI